MSPTFLIRPTQKFVLDGMHLTFKRRLKKSGNYIFVADDGEPFKMSHDQVQEARVENRLLDWSKTSDAEVSTGVVSHRARVTYDSANDQERFEADRDLEYVLAWQANPSTPKTPAGLQPIIDAVYARRKLEADHLRRFEVPPYSVSWLQKRIADYLKCGEKADGLVSQKRHRGNYRQRLSATVLDIMWKHIDDSYLVLNGSTAAGVHEKISDEINEDNKHRSPEDRILCPSYPAVNELTKKLCKFTVSFCREGKQVALERFRLVGSGFITAYANQFWEIDDTRVDLICLHEDRKTVIGRPWLTVVIDRHTRMIMSCVISFSAPDTETALEAMRQALLPKDDLLAANPHIKKQWSASGRPDGVHVDNGKPYNSVAFKRGLTRVGIQHHTLPVLKAWYKGTVERVIGTIMRQVFHTVPGTTYSSIFDRDRETPPESVAEATLADASAKLLSWIVDEYQHRHHRGISATPFALWQQSLATHPQRMPLARQDIEAAMSLTTGRTIRKGGIQIDGLRYLSSHGLSLEASPGSGKGQDVIVRRDSSDLTTVLFLDAGVTDKSAERWYPATICREHLPRVEGKTLLEFRLARALRAQNPEEFGDNDPSWLATYEKVGAKRSEDAADNRLGNRRRAQGEFDKIKKAGERRLAREREVSGTQQGEDLQAQIEALDVASTAPEETTSVSVPTITETPSSAEPDVPPAGLGYRIRTPRGSGV